MLSGLVRPRRSKADRELSRSEFCHMLELVFAVISGPNRVIENQRKQEDIYVRRKDR